MMGILDQIARSRGAFRVRSLNDILAIELARMLGDGDRIGPYLKLVPQYPHAVLADAAKRVFESGITTAPAFEGYFNELTEGSFRGSAKPSAIIGGKVERDKIGVALFTGSRLAFTEVLNLRSSDEDAARSCAALFRRMCEDHPDASVALEGSPADVTRRERLAAIVENTVRENGNPIWKFDIGEIEAALAIPLCRNRQEVRAIVGSLYPELHSIVKRTAEADAVAIGMLAYVRILLHTEVNSPAEKDAA